MPGPLHTEKRPQIPVPHSITPPGRPYWVHDGDTWTSIAALASVEVGDLIEFNFRTRSAYEVNWYLREYVGCVQTTPDGRNWKFSSGLAGGMGAWKGGTVWLPLGKSGRTSGITSARAGGTDDDIIVVVGTASNAHVK